MFQPHYGPRHFLRLIAAVLVCSIVNTCAVPSFAQPPTPAEVEPEPHPGAPMTLPLELTLPDTRLELRRGTAAPYDGILFDAPTLVRWVDRIRWLETRLRLEHDLHVELETAATTSYQTLITRLTESYEREILGQREIINEAHAAIERGNRRIAALERRPPHRAFSIGMGLGAGLTLIAAGIGVFAAH